MGLPRELRWDKVGRGRLGKGKVEEKPGKATNMELESWRANRWSAEKKEVC